MTIDMVIELNKGLIISCVNKFYNIDKEDLYQAGVVGLLKAYKNYRYDGKTKFSSYAYKYIYGEMYLLACENNIKINKDILKLSKMINKTKYALAQKLNKIPTNEEIATFLTLPVERINEALMATDEILSLDNDDNNSLYDVIKDNTNYDDAILLSQGLKYLSDDEKRVIIDKYYNDLTQDEIAKKMLLSQVTVSRYEKRSLSKLKEYMKV